MRRRAAVIALLVATGLTAWLTAFTKFPFESRYESDAAIVVLMANWDGWSPFHLYYFGQDRFGALPYLLMQLWRAVSGMSWTPAAVAFVHIGAAFATAWPVALLFKQRTLAALATVLVLLVMGGAAHAFNISQPYGWQLPLFFGAWAALRWMRERPSWRRGLLALLLSFCACWMSALSAPLLLACAIGEAFAVEPGPRARRLRALVFVPVVLAGALEGVLRGLYQVYAKKNFGHSFRTDVKLQLSGALEAIWAVLQQPEGPGLLLTGIAAASGGYALWALSRSVRTRTVPTVETLNLAVLSGALLGHLLLIGLGDHFRKNGLHPRYLVLAELLAWLCALQVVLSLWQRRRTERSELVLTVALGAAIFASPLWLTRREPVREMARFREEASALAAANPAGAFIAAGYWEVYAVAALAPPGRLLPVILPGNYDRSVMLREPLGRAPYVWVANEKDNPEPRVHADRPFLWVQGHIVEADASARPIDAGGEHWRKFLLTTGRRLTVERRVKCEDVKVSPTPGAELFVLFEAAGRAAKVRAFGADGAEVPLEAPERNGDLFRYRAGPPVARFIFEGWQAPCPVEGVAVLGGAH